MTSDQPLCLSDAFIVAKTVTFVSSLPVTYVTTLYTITSPSDELLEVILKYELSDILINRNEFGGFQIGGTGTHSGTGVVGVAPRKSSSRKYACPCCGMSVRATKVVNIACMDCDEQLLLVG